MATESYRRVSAADVSRTEAAAALDAVFQQYIVPISFSEPVYAIHVEANDVDAASSPIWYDAEGNVAAAAVLGVRGERGWIGGFGVAPELRGRGLGRTLLASMVDRSWEIGLERVTLEVLAANSGARRTYETGGFSTARRLATFECDAKTLEPARGDAPSVEAKTFLDLIDETEPCWQRASASLGHQKNLHAVGDRTAFCIFRHNGERAQLMGLRCDSHDRLARLFASVVEQTGVTRLSLFNEPYDSVLAKDLRSLGWSTVHEQAEMQIERIA